MVGLAGAATQPLLFWLEGLVAQSAEIGWPYWPEAYHCWTSRRVGAAGQLPR